MTDVSYAEFLREVLPLVPDAPEVVAVNAVRNAAIDFCDRSMWWQHVHDPITLMAGEGEYDLDVPLGTVLARPVEVAYRHAILPAVPADELRAMFPQGWRSVTGTPRGYLMSDPGVLRLVPAPDARDEDALDVIMALKPTRDSDDVPAELYEKWLERIAQGAVARLLRLPDQPFYDMAKSALYEQMFLAGVGEARVDRQRDQTRASMRVRMRPFI